MIILSYRPLGASQDGEDDWYLSEEANAYHPTEVPLKRWVRTKSLAKFYEEPRTAQAEYQRLCNWISAGMPESRTMLGRLPEGGSLMARSVIVGRCLISTAFPTQAK